MPNADADTGMVQPAAESADDAAGRLRYEAAVLAKSRASAAAGRIVPGHIVSDWANSLGTGHARPIPRSSHLRKR